MKYSVIGTSNTLGKDSFVEQLRERYPQHEAVSLGRVGASPSVIIPLFASDPSFFSESRFCVIDVCTYDAGAIVNRQFDLTTAEMILRWFGHTSRANGCEPIFLLLHTIHHLQTPTKRAAYYDMVKRVISEGGYLFIDGSAIIAEGCRRSGVSPVHGGYDDPWHMNAETLADIASVLGWFFDSDPHQSPARISVSASIPNFRTVRTSDQAPPKQRRQRRSSAMTFDGVFLPLSKKLRVDIGGGAIIGALLNVSSTHCMLRLRGNGEALISLEFTTYSNWSFEARAVNFSKRIEAERGVIELMPIGIEKPFRTPLPSVAGLEIGDIVVHNGEMGIAYDFHPVDSDTDLARLYLATGADLACRAPADGRRMFANPIRDHAIRSGVRAEVIGDERSAVCRIRPSRDQRVELPGPDEPYLGKITARKAQQSQCSAIELRAGGQQPIIAPLYDELRVFRFEGTGSLSISSIPPGHSFVVEKVVLKPTG